MMHSSRRQRLRQEPIGARTSLSFSFAFTEGVHVCLCLCVCATSRTFTLSSVPCSRGELFIHNTPTRTNETPCTRSKLRISIHRSQSVCGSGRLGIVKMWKNRVDRDLNRKQFDAFMEICAIVPQDDAIAFLVVNLWGKRGRNRLFLEEPVGKTGRSARSRTKYESPRCLCAHGLARARVRGGARLALARSSVIRAALRPRTQLLVLRATSSARPFCFC